MNIFTEQKYSQRTDLWLQDCGGGGLQVWDQQMQTSIYRMEKLQGPTVEDRELYSISCDKPEWKRIYTCIIESLCCTAEINTTL